MLENIFIIKSDRETLHSIKHVSTLLYLMYQGPVLPPSAVPRDVCGRCLRRHDLLLHPLRDRALQRPLPRGRRRRRREIEDCHLNVVLLVYVYN